MSFKKAGLVGLLAAAALAIPASAATVEELQAQVNALLAQLAGLQGGGSSEGCYSFTVDLTEGSTGADVTALQNFLAAKGYFSVAATGYFGAITKAAVAAWQSANGVMPAAGYFGAISRAKYNSMCGGVASDDDDDDDDDSTMGGDDGDLTNFNEISSDDNKIVEGEENEVFGFEFDVEGDVEIDRVDIYLDSTAAGTESENAEDYFQSAILMIDGDEVATLDVEDWDEDEYGNVNSVTGDDDEYRLRFTGLSEVFGDGDNPQVTVAFAVNSNIDSDDLTETWGIELESDSVRFTDGKGFTAEEGASITETFGADSEDVAELSVNSSSDSPDANTLEVSDTDDTEEVEVFVFSIEEENNVDVTINDLTIFATTTTETDESKVISEAFIYDGSTLLGSESVPDGGEINFEDLDLEIGAGEEVDLTVKLSFTELDGVNYAEGEQVIVGFSSIDDAEDANGNDEGDMTISGDPEGDTMTLRTSGLIIEAVSEDADKTFTADDAGEFDQGTFKIVFDLTAFGDDIYVDRTSPVEDNAPGYVTTATSYSTTNTASSTAIGVLNASSGDFTTETNSWFIAEGDTARFTLTVTITATEDTSSSVTLENIGYAATDVDGTASFLVPALAGFETDSITLLEF